MFSLPILLGRSWRSLGDEINFLKWQGLAFSQISPNRFSCFHCRDIQTWPGHLMPWAISPFPVPGIWDLNTNTVWDVTSLHESTTVPPPVEGRGQHLLDLVLKDSSFISKLLGTSLGQSCVLVVNFRSWFMWTQDVQWELSLKVIVYRGIHFTYWENLSTWS